MLGIGYLGAALGPLLVGALRDMSGGFELPLLVLTALGVANIASALVIPRPGRVPVQTIANIGSGRPPASATGDLGERSESTVTPRGKGLDLSFIGKPHEHDPRRVYSTTGTDWQARVDFDRLRRDRLARARMMMEKQDLGAVVCFVGENVRYITSVFQGNWKNNIFIRYCVLPRGGDPVLFETAGSDLECAKIDAPWLERQASGRRSPGSGPRRPRR